jgi:glycosyltransferase involved in cell wall biosynthesis
VSVSFFGAGVNGQALRDLAVRLGAGHVTFHGHVGDVASIWATHHALVLPSRTEGLPLALVEAMMCGRFGIVTSEGGTAEIVEDGRTGFVAAAARVAEFDAAMERAWAVRDEWPSIGLAAGTAVRTLVPADPIASFSADLLTLAQSRAAREAAGVCAHEPLR